MKKGFTLIELLIVIAILGILAIGLIAALDPLEQIKKGTDTSTRNAVEEFYNSALRYYSINQKFPWGTNTATGFLTAPTVSSYIGSIVGAGELKAQFQDDATKLSKIYLTSTHPDVNGNIDQMNVCFAPESKAVRKDINSKYSQGGATIASCPTTDYTSVTCYWCIK